MLYICVYIYIYMCVCMYVCVYVCMHYEYSCSCHNRPWNLEIPEESKQYRGHIIDIHFMNHLQPFPCCHVRLLYLRVQRHVLLLEVVDLGHVASAAARDKRKAGDWHRYGKYVIFGY